MSLTTSSGIIWKIWKPKKWVCTGNPFAGTAGIVRTYLATWINMLIFLGPTDSTCHPMSFTPWWRRGFTAHGLWIIDSDGFWCPAYWIVVNQHQSVSHNWISNHYRAWFLCPNVSHHPWMLGIYSPTETCFGDAQNPPRVGTSIPTSNHYWWIKNHRIFVQRQARAYFFFRDILICSANPTKISAEKPVIETLGFTRCCSNTCCFCWVSTDRKVA